MALLKGYPGLEEEISRSINCLADFKILMRGTKPHHTKSNIRYETDKNLVSSEEVEKRDQMQAEFAAADANKP